ncbi:MULTISPECIES: FAD-dependent oxidoreductase [Sphingobium]|uniref:FAD-dependent oxidoreductase n=1 Tax=Sphingobium TaxID=165695 RepID=UPI002431FD02|nr:FAD-dependent oxidoreductase [Sphingobium yanoikuyae]
MDRRAFLATMAGAAGAAGLVSCHQASGKPAALIHPRRTALAGEAWADADVVVYGATPAGVIAAVSAANLGASAVLIGGWREIQPGGMLAGGLSWTDIRDIDAVGGYARTTMATLAASGGMPGNRYAFDPAVAAPLFPRPARRRRGAGPLVGRGRDRRPDRSRHPRDHHPFGRSRPWPHLH